MAAAEGMRTGLRAEDVRQLWSLACLLAQRQLTAQTSQCLEVRTGAPTLGNYAIKQERIDG